LGKIVRSKVQGSCLDFAIILWDYLGLTKRRIMKIYKYSDTYQIPVLEWKDLEKLGMKSEDISWQGTCFMLHGQGNWDIVGA
jgi:hypothetical protein